MRRLLIAFLLLPTSPLLAQTADRSDMIIVKENAFWAAYVEGNTSDLSKLLLPGFVNVEEQIQNREQVLEFVKEFHSHCTLAPVKILDPSVSFLGPEVATIVYHSVEAPTCGEAITFECFARLHSSGGSLS